MTTTTPPDARNALAELLPCPFCGGAGYIQSSDDRLFFASCRECFCCVGEAYDRSAMPEHMFSSEEGAIAAWNRRDFSPGTIIAGVVAAIATAEPQPTDKARIAAFEAQVEGMRVENAQMAEIGAKAERFRISPDVTVESRGLGQWAICDGGSVLNADGEWEYEPRPSNRPDDFIERTRFPFSEAYSRARAALQSSETTGEK